MKNKVSLPGLKTHIAGIGFIILGSYLVYLGDTVEGAKYVTWGLTIIGGRAAVQKIIDELKVRR